MYKLKQTHWVIQSESGLFIHFIFNNTIWLSHSLLQVSLLPYQLNIRSSYAYAQTHSTEYDSLRHRQLRRFWEITRKIARTKPWKHSNERLNCSPGHFSSHQSTRFSCFLQCEETRQAVSIGPLSFLTAPESLSCEPLRLDLLVPCLLRNMPSTEIVRSHILHELRHTLTRETW